MRTTALLLAATAGLVTGCGQTVPVTPGAPADVGPDAASERVRIQGVWLVESLELAGGEKIDPERVKGVRFVFDGPRFRISEPGRGSVEQFSFALDTTANPKVLVLTELYPDGTPVRGGGTYRGTAPYGTFRGATARAGTFRGATAPYGTYRGGTVRYDAGPVDRQEWIYKFDGETLVVAFRTGRNGGRPVGFTPDAGQPGRVVGGTARAGTSRYEPPSPPTVVVRLKRTTEAPPANPTPVYYGTARGGNYGTSPAYGTRR